MYKKDKGKFFDSVLIFREPRYFFNLSYKILHKPRTNLSWISMVLDLPAVTPACTTDITVNI